MILTTDTINDVDHSLLSAPLWTETSDDVTCTCTGRGG